MTYEFKKNQEIWFEPSDTREKGYKVTVIKVGRLYYTVTRFNSSWELKFPKDTLYRCEYPCGHLYNSEQDAKDHKLASDMFFKLTRSYSIKPTLEQMKKIYEILEIKDD